jgi:hypothetical protein
MSLAPGHDDQQGQVSRPVPLFFTVFSLGNPFATLTVLGSLVPSTSAILDPLVGR